MATAFATDVADPQCNHRGEFTQLGQLIYSQASDTYTFTIPAGTLVLTVGVVITEAFDGTTPTIKIGDGTDDDGFLDSTDIAPATAASAGTPAVKLAEDGGNPYANGKYYASADTLDVVFSPAADGTTGKAIIWYTGLRVDRFGVPSGVASTATL